MISKLALTGLQDWQAWCVTQKFALSISSMIRCSILPTSSRTPVHLGYITLQFPSH